MTRPVLYSILLILFGLYSCSPKITTTIAAKLPPIEYDQDVIIIGIHQIAPENSIVIGEVKIGDTGFSTDCDYTTVTELAKLEARKAGGNAIKIKEHLFPSIWSSSCHRITADILVIEDIESLDLTELQEKNEFKPMVNQLHDYDIIIRTNAEKVICTITDEDDEFVYFDILVNDAYVKTKLPRDQISSIVYSKEHKK